MGDLPPQTTGITANDFRSPVTYLVSAEAGNRKEWRVSIFLYGDVNLDKKVDVGDAILVLKHIVGLAELNAVPLKAAKVSAGTKDISVSDAILILRHIVG